MLLMGVKLSPMHFKNKIHAMEWELDKNHINLLVGQCAFFMHDNYRR